MRQSAPLPSIDAVQRPDTLTHGSPTVVLARLALATSHPGLLESLDGSKVARMVTAARLTTLAESLSTSQASSLLCVNTSTIGRRRKRGMLYGFPHPRGWRYPTWQFAGGATIPGLASLLSTIPSDLSAVSVRALMLAPRPGLADGSKRISPREWLLNGGDPARVAILFDVFRPKTTTPSEPDDEARTVGEPPAQASQYVRLPSTPGTYRVETYSGTVHIISTLHGTWERRPAPGSQPFHYDYRKAPISALSLDWEVGGLGHIDVADETYGSGATWHRTSIIVSITDEGIQDDHGSETYHVDTARPLPDAPLDEHRTIL